MYAPQATAARHRPRPQAERVRPWSQRTRPLNMGHDFLRRFPVFYSMTGLPATAGLRSSAFRAFCWARRDYNLSTWPHVVGLASERSPTSTGFESIPLLTLERWPYGTKGRGTASIPGQGWQRCHWQLEPTMTIRLQATVGRPVADHARHRRYDCGHGHRVVQLAAISLCLELLLWLGKRRAAGESKEDANDKNR